MNRDDIEVNLESVPLSQVMDLLQSKIAGHVERAGFELKLIQFEGDNRQALKLAAVQIDTDLFLQVMINLVDNAIKFSTKSSQKLVEVSAEVETGGICFAVRDYGPGVAHDQMKKIFKLFYRSENELTRETVGTGIGLALVNQLVTAMDGQVDVINMDPGVQFRIHLLASRE
jgi:signal transduction histidine kinase